MSQLTLNGLTKNDNIVLLSEVPNIIKVGNPTNGGKSGARLSFLALTQLDTDEEYVLTINGEQLIGTFDTKNVSGNRFLLSKGTNIQARRALAYNLTKALRSLNVLPTQYRIWQDIAVTGEYGTIVNLEAFADGNKYDIELGGELAEYISTELDYGYDYSEISGDIEVNMYNIEPTPKFNSDVQIGEYVTTLTKRWIGENIYFDLSPLVRSTVKNGEIACTNLVVTNDSVLIGCFDNVYMGYGFKYMGSMDYIPQFDTTFLALNTENELTRYIYNPTLEFSVYCANGTGTLNATILYLDSTKQLLGTQSVLTFINKPLNDISVSLNDLFDDAYYVQLSIPDNPTVTFNVIKPNRLADPSEIERVYWRGCYNSNTFMDFTGGRTEEHKLETETYSRQAWDYYETNDRHDEDIYTKNVGTTVTLKTHLIDYSGVEMLLEAEHSKFAWVYSDGLKRMINITSITADESDSHNNYQVSLSYQYL